jgi:hypothetical protein
MNKPTKSTDPIINRLIDLHKQCIENARRSVAAALELGQTLVSIRKSGRYPDWYLFLDATGIPPRTASRYMGLAAKVAIRGFLLKDGVNLVDLYREFGLIQASTGGGRRLGESELARRKFDVRFQLTRHWGEVDGWLAKIDKAVEEDFNPFTVEDIEVDLDATERRLESTLQMVRDAKLQKGAVEVETMKTAEEALS